MPIEKPTQLIFEDAMEIIQSGGEIFRYVKNRSKIDRFFYQLRDGELYCRVNEVGGWNPAVGIIRKTDEFFKSTTQGIYEKMVW